MTQIRQNFDQNVEKIFKMAFSRMQARKRASRQKPQKATTTQTNLPAHILSVPSPIKFDRVAANEQIITKVGRIISSFI